MFLVGRLWKLPSFWFFLPVCLAFLVVDLLGHHISAVAGLQPKQRTSALQGHIASRMHALHSHLQPGESEPSARTWPFEGETWQFDSPTRSRTVGLTAPDQNLLATGGWSCVWRRSEVNDFALLATSKSQSMNCWLCVKDIVYCELIVWVFLLPIHMSALA